MTELSCSFTYITLLSIHIANTKNGFEAICFRISSGNLYDQVEVLHIFQLALPWTMLESFF